MATLNDKMRFLCISCLLCSMLFYTGSVEISRDPNMQKGQPSVIFCEVGTITGGVTFFTRPSNNKGGCLGPGGLCSSSIGRYSISQNSSTVMLNIDSIDCGRETGNWYCRHSSTISNQDLWLNCSNIFSQNGDLVYNGLILDINSSNIEQQVNTMIISCANPTPTVTWKYKSKEQPTFKNVPESAVSLVSQATYNGSTCDAGETFTSSTISVSYTDEEFGGKTDVFFSFTYYGLTEESVVPVSFREESATSVTTVGATASSPNNRTPFDENNRVAIIAGGCAAGVVGVAGVSAGVVFLYKKSKFGKK